MASRGQYVDRIVGERVRQLNLPGSEWDLKREPNDWLAIAGKYLFEASSTKNQQPTQAQYEEVLIKSAAVILAALEHCDLMVQNKKLK